MKNFEFNNLKDFLDSKVKAFNTLEFIPSDPISIPHLFSKKEDIEITAFLTATLAWGQRPTILKNCEWLIERMDDEPYTFIQSHTPADRKPFTKFIHRTFNGIDCVYFLKALQQLYLKSNGLEGSISGFYNERKEIDSALSDWRQLFFSFKPQERTKKHVSNPLNNSSSKRLCMFLRWMIRKDNAGVDFGIWKTIPPSALYAPLDLHSGRVARKLGLLQRNQNDWKAVTELTLQLRKFDPVDPVKYDFALYGLGINEKF